MHQNDELKHEIEELKELLNEQGVKIMYFEDLNVDEIKKIRANY